MNRIAGRGIALLGVAALATAFPGSAAATNVTGLVITVPTTPLVVSGTITAGGHPVAGAQVWLYGSQAVVRTDASGHYEFHNQIDGTYQLAVNPHAGAPDAQAGWFASGQPGHFSTDLLQATNLQYNGTKLTADMSMPLGHSITGRVTRATGGSAVPGGLVHAFETDNGGPSGTFFDARATTDLSGGYRIRGLIDATFHLAVAPPGISHLNLLAGCYADNQPNGFASKCSKATALVVQGANLAHRNVALPDGHRVRGRVRDPHGAPLCFHIEQRSTGEPSNAQLPDAYGCDSFILDGVPGGTLTLDVMPRGSSHFLKIEKQVSVGSSDVNVGTIWPNIGDTISGRVVTSAGDPVPNASVTLYNPNIGSAGPTTTDADGRYLLSAEHRPWRVLVETTNTGINGRSGYYDAATANHWTADVHQATVLVAGSHAGINLRLPPGYTIAGRLKNGTGGAVAGVVSVGGFGARSVTDAQGNWAVTGLYPGDYEIRIDPTDGTSIGYPRGFYTSSAGHFTTNQGAETLVHVGP